MSRLFISIVAFLAIRCDGFVPLRNVPTCLPSSFLNSPTFTSERVSSSSSSIILPVTGMAQGEESTSKLGLSPKITGVDGMDDFLDIIAEDDRLCVVKFYASWCKSCKKFGLKYKRLASEHADKVDRDGTTKKSGDVRFSEVEYGKNLALCRSFGIKKLPYIQIYKRGVGKIDEFSCGPKFFETKLVNKLNELLEMSDEEMRFNIDMEEGQALGENMMERLFNSTTIDTATHA